MIVRLSSIRATQPSTISAGTRTIWRETTWLPCMISTIRWRLIQAISAHEKIANSSWLRLNNIDLKANDQHSKYIAFRIIGENLAIASDPPPRSSQHHEANGVTRMQFQETCK